MNKQMQQQQQPYLVDLLTRRQKLYLDGLRPLIKEVVEDLRRNAAPGRFD
jgi:hypothetical protein